MTSQLVLRGCCLARTYLPRETITPRLLLNLKPAVIQTRNAGHAKWQNIAKTKQANDLNKCKVISRYSQMVCKAVIEGGRQPDPKLNSKLAAALQEASKLSIPKATMERAIERGMNRKIIAMTIDIQGPSSSAIIVRCETDNVGTLRRELKRILRKFDSHIMPDSSLVGMFQSRGFIRTTCKTKDNRDINEEFAEDAAIIANAEDVQLETFEEATDEELKNMWVFQTDASTLDPCRGELEKLGFKVISSNLDLIPYRYFDFGKDIYEQVVKLVESLSELEQVLDVFHNVQGPQEEEQ